MIAVLPAGLYLIFDVHNDERALREEDYIHRMRDGKLDWAGMAVEALRRIAAKRMGPPVEIQVVDDRGRMADLDMEKLHLLAEHTKLRRNPAPRSDGTDPAQNKVEIEHMLASAPSDWKTQFGSGMNARRATGQGGGSALNIDNALLILGITAGGNASGDAALGGNKVPPAVRAAAMKGLRLSHENNYGAWDFIGIARGIQLATQPGVPNETLGRMSNYFGRHVKDQGSSNFGNDSNPSRGYMAWLNWGGDPGYEWASGKKRAKLNPSTVMNALQLAFDASPDNWKHVDEYVDPGDGKMYKVWSIVILDGSMAGMYTSSNMSTWRYATSLWELPLAWQWHQPDAVDLCKHVSALLQRLAPILTSMSQHCGVVVPELDLSISQSDARRQLAAIMEAERQRDPDDDDADVPGAVAEYYNYRDQILRAADEKRRKMPLEYVKFNRCAAVLRTHPRPHESSFQLAFNLYILGQAAGVDADRIALMLAQNPLRLKSAAAIRIPPDRNDRAKYAKEFFRTWSLQKAVRAIAPNVEGSLPESLQRSVAIDLKKAKTLLSFVPSWKQIAKKDIANGAPREVTDQELTEWIIEVTTIYTGIAEMTHSSLAEMRPLLQKFNRDDRITLRDTISMIRAAASVLAETHEGRQLIRAMNEKDWKRLLRGHDQALAADEEFRRQEGAKKASKGIRFKEQAKKFNLPEGVTPLTTEREYWVEGAEMEHCVGTAGYCHRKSSFEFAFKAHDGTRATLELSTAGAVLQFRGPHNGEPSPATEALLEEFLRLNQANIELMKEGKFPAKPVKRAPATYDREAEDNPTDITLDLGSMGRHPLYGSRHWGERVAERIQSAPLSVRKQFYEIYLKVRRGQTKERYINERLDIQFGGAKGKIGNYLIVAYHGGVPDMITVLLNQELISAKNAMASLVQADEIFSPPLSFTIERPKSKATTAPSAPEPTKPLTRKQREAQMMMEMARRNGLYE